MVLKDMFYENLLVEMANLNPKSTGFSRYIWVGPPDPRHGHRIKVVSKLPAPKGGGFVPKNQA